MNAPATEAPKWKTRAGDRAHYQPTSTRIWHDEWFRGLSVDAERAWLFLLTCPATNSIPGLFALSDVATAKRLRMPLDRFHAACAEFGESKFLADWDAGLVWMRNAWKHRPPSGPNTVKHWRGLVAELPECRLLWVALTSIRQALAGWFLGPDSFLQAFDACFPNLSKLLTAEPIRDPIPEPIPEPLADPGRRIQDPGSDLFLEEEEITGEPAVEQPAAPPPPPELPLRDRLRHQQRAWEALERVACEEFPDRVPPRPHCPRDREEALRAQLARHGGDPDHLAESERLWIRRNPDYARKRNPAGAPEVFLTQADNYLAPKPEPAAPCCEAPGCQIDAAQQNAGVQLCDAHFFASWPAGRDLRNPMTAEEVREVLEQPSRDGWPGPFVAAHSSTMRVAA